MPVHLHRAHRTDRLADDLARLLAVPGADPFVEDVVVVPARGVERWLTQRLSHHLGASAGRADGICAAVRFVSPRSLVAMLTGTERTDPWDPDRLLWPLLATIDEVAEQPWATPLALHLGYQPRPGDTADLTEQRRDRRYSLARRVAWLFAGYANQRPTLLTDWRQGQLTDGHGGPLPPDLHWQAQLFAALLERVDAPDPVQRHRDAVAAIAAGAPLALPGRLSLFGHTRLSVTDVELLAAVGQTRQVHLWLPQASAALWQRLVPLVDGGPVERAVDESAAMVGNPLLASLGRDAREVQRTLSLLQPTTDTSTPEPAVEPTTLLGWLQHDLRTGQAPTVDARNARSATADGSVQVHACHGPARQVDVLREVLLGLLADDPTLQPRDILIMCPAIDDYASLFESGFALADVEQGGHPAHGLRVRLADRGPARINPLLDVVTRVVGIASGRATVTEVLDLASLDVVRRRFGFDDDALEKIAGWAVQGGARWGLTAELRAPYSLANVHQNTWRAAIDRVLLGVVMPGSDLRPLAGTLPLEGIGSAEIDLAGRFAEFLTRLQACVEQLLAATAATDWVAALRRASLSLADVPAADAWQRAQADRELQAVEHAAAQRPVALRLADMRALLEQQLGPRPSRANFRTGALTVATMVPMRSVPHRVICLVGLDDGAFPRSTSVDGDDVLGRRPFTGERDARAEDRQLLLDAVLAATERLVITYSGRDIVRGGELPPAVPVGELLDALDVTGPERVRDRLLTKHPLQPFDAVNFEPGALVGTAPSQPFSFDAGALAGARAATGARVPQAAFISQRLAPLPVPDGGATVPLADLQSFFAHPVRAFVRQRLDVSLPWDVPEPSDALPISLDGLQQWGIGDRMLSQVIAGADIEAALVAERLRGELPPLALGQAVMEPVEAKVRNLVAQAAAELSRPATTVDVDVTAAGVRVAGQVPGVREQTLLRVSYSRLGPKQRLAAWIDLLAVTVAAPEVGYRAVVIGGGSYKSAERRTLGPVAPEDAAAVLAQLLDVHQRGLCEPIPLTVKTSARWAERRGDDEVRAARVRQTWEGEYRRPGENADAYHELVWGSRLPLVGEATRAGAMRGLLAEHAREDEYWNTQATRFGQYAVRVWQPLLEREH